MAASPEFATNPVVGMAQVSTANTNRDGTGTVVDVLTGGSNGTLINKVRIQAVGTTTAGVIRLYLYDGTNTRLMKEILVTAKTPSTTVEAWSTTVMFSGYDLLVLPSASWVLKASTHNAETFNIFAVGAEL